MPGKTKAKSVQNLFKPLVRNNFLESMLSGPFPFVSVIIPVYNDSQRLRGCLQALSRQTYPEKLFEVIVVDNASSMSPANIVCEFSFAKLCFEEKSGSYAARNKGIIQSRGHILAFADSDCLPDPDWLEKGVKSLLVHPRGGAVGGAIKFFFNEPDRPNLIELYDSLISLNQRRCVEVSNFAVTANLFTYKNTIETIGPFCETLKSGGDREWGNRLVDAGYPLIYGDDVVVRHPARSDFRNICGKHLRVVGGGMALRKYFPSRYRGFLKSQIKDFLLLGQTRLVLKDGLLTIQQKIGLLFLIRLVGFLRIFERFRILVFGRLGQ